MTSQMAASLLPERRALTALICGVIRPYNFGNIRDITPQILFQCGVLNRTPMLLITSVSFEKNRIVSYLQAHNANYQTGQILSLKVSLLVITPLTPLKCGVSETYCDDSNSFVNVREIDSLRKINKFFVVLAHSVLIQPKITNTARCDVTTWIFGNVVTSRERTPSASLKCKMVTYKFRKLYMKTLRYQVFSDSFLELCDKNQ